MLQVRALEVGYGGATVLHEVELRVGVGQIITVIGPNGAGKTTLLNALMGVHGGRGTVRLAGREVSHLPVEARVRAGLALVPERRELFGSLTVADNLRLGAFRHRSEGRRAMDRRLDDIYDLFPRLRERHAQLAGTLSGGERQMLAMGRALMGEPDMLMLDEPSLGLAPLIVREVFAVIAALRARARAVLLVEQNARAALQVADYGYVLENGRVSLEGPSAALAQDRRVVDTYLGTGLGPEGG